MGLFTNIDSSISSDYLTQQLGARTIDTFLTLGRDLFSDFLLETLGIEGSLILDGGRYSNN